MNLRLAFHIAKTHLSWPKKKQTLVALGVTFGISMFIVMISFMTGVNAFLFDIAIDGSPHIRIYNPVESTQLSPAQKQNPDTSHLVMVSGKRPKNELPKLKNGLRIASEIEKLAGRYRRGGPGKHAGIFQQRPAVQLPVTVVGTDADKEISACTVGQKNAVG